MRDSIGYWLMIAVCLTYLPVAWAVSNDPGGKGVLKSDSITSFRNDCFKTNSATVIEVCAEYTINWKLWTLMGEPVGDYNVAWKLRSITLKDPQRSQVRITYTPDQLPTELKKAAKSLELYIDGYVYVYAGGDTSSSNITHRLNTGAAVRAGAGSSFNVPGSTNWDKFFIRGNSACEENLPTSYVDTKTAKEMFIKGIQLSNLRLCPAAGVSELTKLEIAIEKLCKKPNTATKYRFCLKDAKEKSEDNVKSAAKKERAGHGAGNSVPDKKNFLDDQSGSGNQNESIADMLDEKAEQPQIQKRLEQERAKYRRVAEAACDEIMHGIDACYARAQCPRPVLPSGVTKDECQSARPQQATNMIYLTSSDCDHECQEESSRRRKREREEEAERWRNRWGTIYESCKPYYAQQEHYTKCEKNFKTSCNPRDLRDQNACVEQQMNSSGPTEQDARAHLKKEWDAKARAGKNTPAGNKETQPTNFLD